ncbi:hypothetical protein TorRG33x02_332100 [Trema orientale]|uniref:Transmembrane protein n=1 Tax=Trema orientale TaxID=63057 RepID=A0A2P5B5M3_TREOI|nr:hypothetical protein TorRG33x02_332100 [Trema orientale]
MNLVSKLNEKLGFGSGRATSSSTFSRAFGQYLRLLGSRVESGSSFSGFSADTVAGTGGSSPESGFFGATESIGVGVIGSMMFLAAIFVGRKEAYVRKNRL